MTSKRRRTITAAEVEALIANGPDRGAMGTVEVRQIREPDGRFSYVVTQMSGDGGWWSDHTFDLALADLAAETLAIRNRSRLIKCRECDAALEDER
jgi:hypothetical protein